MTDPVTRYDALRHEHKFTFLVFYRGSWCPFCQAWLNDLQSLSNGITAAGGHVVAVTAEPESELHKTRATSGFDGEVIVDTQNLLAKELKRRGVVDVAISEHKGYKHGIAQPAVVVEGEQVGVVYAWGIVPGMMNLGGAKDRPILSQVWDNADAKIRGAPEVHAKVASMGFMQGMRQKILG